MPPGQEPLTNGGSIVEKPTPAAELDGSSPDWRRGMDLLASRNSATAAAGDLGHPKCKPDLVLPLFTRPGIYPDPHSPFAVSPLPAHGGILNVPISPALSLTPTLFSYSPSPGMSPFAGSRCFSFNTEEMKHYLHSQACSVFNYHLSPRTFPRYPGLLIPPLPRQMPPEDQPPFPIKLQPPPVGRKNRERLESGRGAVASPASPGPPQIKVEPLLDKELESRDSPEKDDVESGEVASAAMLPKSQEGEKAMFARPLPPSWPMALGEKPKQEEGAGERTPQEPVGEQGSQEKREDAVMPPKLRLKRRWNGDRQVDAPEERQGRKPQWEGHLGTPHILLAPKAVTATAAVDT